MILPSLAFWTIWIESHFEFEVLVSFATAISLDKSGIFKGDMNSWTSITKYYTYVLLAEGNKKYELEETTSGDCKYSYSGT